MLRLHNHVEHLLLYNSIIRTLKRLAVIYYDVKTVAERPRDASCLSVRLVSIVQYLVRSLLLLSTNATLLCDLSNIPSAVTIFVPGQYPSYWTSVR